MKKLRLLCMLLCVCFSFVCLACVGKESGEGGEKSGLPSVAEQTPSAPSQNVGTNEPDEGMQEPQEPTASEEPPASEQPSVAEEPNEPEPQVPPAPKPQAQPDVLLACTASSLNVRKGAGTSYAVMGTLDKNDMVMPVSKEGSWYKIYYMRTYGYISASYVTEVSFAKGSVAVEKVIDEGKKLLGIPYELGAQRYHWGNGS